MTTEPQPLVLPTADWTGWLTQRVTGELAQASEFVKALKNAAPGDPVILGLWNSVGISTSNASAVASLLSSVHPEPAVVSLAEQFVKDVSAFTTDLMLDPEVFAQLASVDRADLDQLAQRVLDKALLGFRRSGVDRDEATRALVRALDERITDLTQTFSRTIRDDRSVTRVPASVLDGLPEDFAASHPVEDDGMVAISTDYPDTNPVLSYSRDPHARRAVATTFNQVGFPANQQVLADLLATRHEYATLLGYPDWPTYNAEVKMIGSGEAIGAFIEHIASAAAARAESDAAELTAAVGEALDAGNARFAFEQVKRARFGLDPLAVRTYFEFPKVRAGLLDVTSRLFGVRYEPVEVPAWHDDVASYDVSLDGRRLGRIHLDLHPREGKYSHAAQFDLVSGVRGVQLAEGVLVCNFPRGLMQHSEVVTLFHEFGHLMHHVLAGRHDWVRFSGVATEWDFVEAPSQLLEEWAWDADVLRSFATDERGEPIPSEFVATMRAAEEFGKGYLARTQMYYAAMSYEFHRDRPADLIAAMLDLNARYSKVAPLPDTYFFARFGHLAGYSSAYYTYMWSQVIAKDLFTGFDPADLMNPGAASRYRDTVLAPGGAKDAADLVADFLGRPYTAEAFERWLAS